MSSAKTNLFFDIETGGKRAWESSILSLGYGTSQGDVNVAYAAPRPGSQLYRWSEKQIWEPIREMGTKGAKIGTEKEALEKFLGVLEGAAPSGATLTGWNIGTTAQAAGPGVRGFDIPFLMRRAREYGLESRYRSAIGGLTIRDLGAEYALKIATAVERHGAKLVGEGVLHEDLFEQAVGFMKQARRFEHQFGVPRSQLAGELQKSGVRFAGWQLETVHKAMGFGGFAAHEVGADVAATMRLAEAASTELDEAFVRNWAPIAFEKKLVAGLKAAPYDPTLATPQRFADIMGQAATMEARRPDLYSGVAARALAEVNEYAKTVGGSMEAVRAGRGLEEVATRIGASKVSTAASRIGLGAGFQAALDLAKAHKGKIGVGVGVAGLLALQPGSWFSGADDQYNTIEGLPHGGMSAEMRRTLTDFGSGFTEGLKGFWRSVAAKPGQIRRTFEVANLVNKESNRAIAHITKEIAQGVMQKKPLELGVAGVTAAKAAYMAAEIGMGAATPGTFAIGIGGFIGTKWAYELIKKRNAIKQAVGIAKAHPLEAKLGASIAGGELAHQVGKYIRTGERNLASTYIRAGGGEYGRESVLSHLETMHPTGQVDLVQRITNKVVGKDDFWNVIEGLQHGGFAEEMRKVLTPFGSGWDALRALTRAGEEFGSMIAGRGFKSALRTATKVRELGKGQSGTAYLMRSKFRGREFEFVRKIGDIGEHEIPAMRALQETVGPTVYSSRKGTIDMELFAGKTMEDVFATADKSAAEAALAELHRVGYAHKDIHLGNIMQVNTPQGFKYGIIDMGRAQPLSKDPAEAAKQITADLDFLRGQFQYMAADPFAAQAPAGNIMAQLRAQPTHLEGSFSPTQNKVSGDDDDWNSIEGIFGDFDEFGSGWHGLFGKGTKVLSKQQFKRRISGKDDDYNTIEGLPHGGEAERMRRALTEFGSGWIRAALEKGISREAIAAKWIGTKAGTGVYGLTKEAFMSKAMAAKTEEGFVRFLRGSHRVQGDTERFLVTEAYRAGGLGQTFKLAGIESGQTAIYKTAKASAAEAMAQDITGKMLISPSTMKAAGGQAGLVKQFQEGGPIPKYIDEYMGQVSQTAKRVSGGKANLKLEAEMQRKAREEMGDVVPAVLGETKRGFIQEFAGVPLPHDKRAIPALEKMEKMWGSMLTSSGERVRHFDPQIENVVRKGSKLRMIDFGVAAQGPALSRQSQDTAEDILSTYVAKMRQELDPGKFKPPSPPAGPPPMMGGAGGTAIVGSSDAAAAAEKAAKLAGHSVGGVAGKATSPATKMVAGPPPVVPTAALPRPAQFPPGAGPPNHTRKLVMQQKHKEATMRLSKNAKDPGRRHRLHTSGTLIL